MWTIAGIVLFALALYLFWPREGRSTPISKVHAGKKDTHKFKFDPVETRKRGLVRPTIDLSNIPSADARVEKVLKTVQTSSIETHLRELSGETAATIGGARVTLETRNSFT